MIGILSARGTETSAEAETAEAKKGRDTLKSSVFRPFFEAGSESARRRLSPQIRFRAVSRLPRTAVRSR
ncbi:hypothetical protein B9G55_15000 [Saccharibacillus sp. O16]|nr:hypothetical protein B9G55_15000 [Saccharibacillus sp. O16]